jgi:hypothetical protein
MTMLVLALTAAIALIWVAGGFLWPRPQFDRPGTPWSTDTLTERGSP